MRASYGTRLKMLVPAQLDMLKRAEMDEEIPDATLDLFEERLEELTAAARERVALAGDSDPGTVDDADDAAPPFALAMDDPDSEEKVVVEEVGDMEEEALDTTYSGWRDENDPEDEAGPVVLKDEDAVDDDDDGNDHDDDGDEEENRGF